MIILDLLHQLNVTIVPMDTFISFFYQKGFYLVAGLAVLKILLIFLYRGLDIAYLFENFLVIYTYPGLEANERRKQFRFIHNIVTVAFYFALIVWLAIYGVVKYAGD